MKASLVDWLNQAAKRLIVVLFDFEVLSKGLEVRPASLQRPTFIVARKFLYGNYYENLGKPWPKEDHIIAKRASFAYGLAPHP